jgi:hypothetical protein
MAPGRSTNPPSPVSNLGAKWKAFYWYLPTITQQFDMSFIDTCQQCTQQFGMSVIDICQQSHNNLTCLLLILANNHTKIWHVFHWYLPTMTQQFGVSFVDTCQQSHNNSACLLLILADNHTTIRHVFLRTQSHFWADLVQQFLDYIRLKCFSFWPIIFLALFLYKIDAHYSCCLIGAYSSVVLDALMEQFFCVITLQGI